MAYHEGTEAQSAPAPFDEVLFSDAIHQVFQATLGIATVVSSGDADIDTRRRAACMVAVMKTFIQMCSEHHRDDETPADCARRLLEIYIDQYPHLAGFPVAGEG